MRSQTIIRTGAAIGGLAVVIGAFGAHALSERLDGRSGELFDLATQYQMYHALALLLAGLLARTGYRTSLAAWSFLLGTAIFSGSLYALALGAPRWFGAITPVGGTLLIAGWTTLAFARSRHRHAQARQSEPSPDQEN